MKPLALCLVLILVVSACETQSQQEGAHVHGVARLNIALDAPRQATIELEAPAESFYGFEYEPTSAADIQARDAALALLRTRIAELVVLPPDLGCNFDTLSVDVLEEDHADEAEHEAAEGQTAEHEAVEGEHREVHATYRLTCAADLAGTVARVALGDHFAGIEELEVVYLAADGQRSSHLEGGTGDFEF